MTQLNCLYCTPQSLRYNVH